MLNKNMRKSFFKKGQNIPYVSKPSPWMQRNVACFLPPKGNNTLSCHNNLERQHRCMSFSCHLREVTCNIWVSREHNTGKSIFWKYFPLWQWTSVPNIFTFSFALSCKRPHIPLYFSGTIFCNSGIILIGSTV